MRYTIRIPAFGIAVPLLAMALSACGGGGSSGAPAALNPGVQPGTGVAGPAATANGTINIRVPAMSGSSIGRKPAYISAGTTGAAVFIDGATTPAGSTTSCTSSACTIAWSAPLTVPASHSFAVEIDNGTSVLAANKQSYAIVLGNNGTLSPGLTLNAVAAQAALTAETCTGATCTGTLQVADAAGNPITNSGTNPNFDNGTLTFASAATATGTVSSGGSIATVSTAGTYAYTTTCAATSGQFQTAITPSAPAGSGAITTAELTGRSLAYPASITPLELYQCAAGPAILPGHIYVATQAGGGGTGSVVVFAGNLSGTVNAAPLATIGGGGTTLNNPLGMTVDSSGKIYVVNGVPGGGAVLVFAANPSGTVTTAPATTITGGNTGLNNPAGVGIDSTGKIWVANHDGQTITDYAANATGNAAPLATITGLNSPEGIAFDPGGSVYTSNSGSGPSIQKYSNTGTLLATMTGGATGLNGNFGIAIDSGGNIYVANHGAGAITRFGNPSAGTSNPPPIATITGSNTGLSTGAPIGAYRVATDFNGKVYGGNFSSISVFPNLPVGTLNETPLWTIAGPATGLTGNAVSGIAIR